MSDPEILESIRKQHYTPAIKKLYAYFPVVKKFIARNSGTHQEAEDVFQEALIIFCNKAADEHFVLGSSLHTYLFGIARLLWMEELRRKSKTVKLELPGMISEDASPGTRADIEEDRKTRLAQDAVMKLGAKCRELLELFYFKKQSMADIAETLGFSSERTAKNQKYRCLEKAREYYQASSH